MVLLSIMYTQWPLLKEVLGIHGRATGQMVPTAGQMVPIRYQARKPSCH
jgi:hypothetical protein